MTPLLLLLLAADPAASAAVGRSVTVTFAAPGPVLEARPLDDRRRPLVVQELTATPDGAGHRYEVTLYGLDPGTHDLRDALRRPDGSALDGVPAVPVTVTSGLPAGQILPHDLPAEAGPRVGGYRTLLVALGVAWGLGLLGLVASFVLPRRRAAVVADKPVTLADRLRPLVAGAAAGTLKREELAALERSLFAFWRTRLGLDAADPHAALGRLHADPQAGPLLSQLEAWLHQPVPKPPADIGALLAPYRELPADAVPLPAGGTR